MFNNILKKLNKYYLFVSLSLLRKVRGSNFKKTLMLGLFKKKTEKEKLQLQYQNLLKEAHRLSATNRKLSDQKVFEAEEVMKRLDNLS